MKKKILAIFRKFNYFGSVNNSLDFILNLDKSQHDITVVFLKRKASENNAKYIKILNKENIKYYFLDDFFGLKYEIIRKIPNFLKSLIIKKNWKKIKKKIDSFDYFYLNDHLADQNFIIKLLPLSRIIYHIHYSKNLLDFKTGIINLYKNSKLNIVNSNFTLKQLVELGVNIKKILNLNIAIDHNNWIYDDRKSEIIRKKVGLKKDKLVIAGSGPISSRKGTDIFYETFKLVKKNNLENDIFFLWLGDLSNSGLDMRLDEINNNQKYSNFSIKLKENMIKDGIKVLKISNDPFEIFNMIDVLLVSSRTEVGPLTMLECMCLQKIIISYNGCGASSEALSKNCGILVTDNNPYLFYEEIKKIKNEYIDTEQIKKNAQIKILNEYSISNKIKKFKI